MVVKVDTGDGSPEWLEYPDSTRDLASSGTETSSAKAFLDSGGQKTFHQANSR
jgi:hypothetical protein